MSKRKRKLFRKMWNFRKVNDDTGEIKKYQSKEGSLYYIPDFPNVVAKGEKKESGNKDAKADTKEKVDVKKEKAK